MRKWVHHQVTRRVARRCATVEKFRTLSLMHAYRRFVQTEMDKRGWAAADLHRSSGLSRQNLSRILRDDREQLQQRPDAATITALAKAFSVDESVVLTHVAEAMGLPTSRVEVAAAADLSNEELLRVLAERLKTGGNHEPPTPHPAPHATPAPVEDRTLEDGPTRDGDGFGLAAMTGTSALDRLDREADAAGEESQDPEDWT